MTTPLRVAELDFDTIKNNLKTFLAAKPEFTDANFEGSGLSVLIDLLAYNTHYNAVIGNMLTQELYLDTAVKPTSLALIAKRLGYTPQSIRAASANVRIQVFPPDAPTSLTLGKNAVFNTSIDGSFVKFVTRDAHTIYPTAGQYIFENVEIVEGSNAVFKYVVDTSQPQRFEIPSTAIDTTLLRVYVQDSISSTDITEWSRFDSIADLTSNTNAYFVKVNENGNYEVYFGDGIFGKSIVNGNVIMLDYVSTNGPVANGASVFTFNDTISGYGTLTVTTINSATGGANAESTDSIRKNAQNTVYAQNRAITEKDYITLISKFMPVESVSVWGGETLTPPVYGKVFISVKQPYTIAALSDDAKTKLLSDIRSRTSFGIVHEIVDPEYVYIKVNSEVKYDPSKTSLDQSTLSTIILQQLGYWATNNLSGFNSDFEYSKLVAFIDTIDNAIVANDTSISFAKTLNYYYNIAYPYTFNFYCSIKQSNSLESNITSSAFRCAIDPSKDVYLADDNGSLYIYYISNAAKVVLQRNVGTVDYSNGIITLSATMVTGGSLNAITVNVIPTNKVSIQSRNNIMMLRTNDVNLTLKAI